jgi:hypothetical protein
MAQKEVEESHNQTDVRYIRRHPKDDHPQRLGLAALLIAVALILLITAGPVAYLSQCRTYAIP